MDLTALGANIFTEYFEPTSTSTEERKCHNLKFFSSLLTLNTRPCIYVGYFTLYIFTAFMFWINAMAANIFFKFSSILSTRNNENENKKFLLYTIYAQVSVHFEGERH